MDSRLWLEIFGYAASALIAISLMMNSLLRLRLLNILGAAAFATYGFLIHAYPVAVLNGIIVLVNAFHLLKMWRTRKLRLSPLARETAVRPASRRREVGSTQPKLLRRRNQREHPVT